MNWFTRRRLWTIVTLAFIVGAIEFLPAYPFEDRINQALPAPWHLSVSGTVWRGFGVLQAGQTADALTVPLTWTFDPLAFTRLRLAWKVVPDSPLLSGAVKIGAGWQSWELRDAALTMDAAVLAQLFPVLAPFSPSGVVHLGTPADSRLTYGYGNEFRLKGDARIEVERLGLAPFGGAPLGDYQVRITARGTAIDYAIAKSSGALKLDGSGSIQTAPPRSLTYAGHVTPSPALPDAMLATLKTIGTPAADGRLRIDWTSPW